ncbi:cysteine hydrolase family protein [Vibrio gallicus]|uniref:cysteine hydrolase family protein n=1 Tax=Vibrio gallicus TaxID=190897 RepID=UPI0021C2828E|nr:cysteine hydrolase family protein [Vibrio gallicus]
MSNQALIVIDLQNDYFPQGKFPLWNTEHTLNNVKQAMIQALQNNVLIVHVQHIADPKLGSAPFFNHGTQGVDIHPQIMEIAPQAQIVIKRYADGFHCTNLDEVLQQHNVSELVLCGMMTQNCITHTALSKTAEKYNVSVLSDCTTTVDEMVHKIALNALKPRIVLATTQQIFG